MDNSQIDINEVPQELLDMIKNTFEADPKIRQMRIQQNLYARSGNIRMGMFIGKQINDLFSKVVQTYLEESEQEYHTVELSAAQLPKSDRNELVEIVITLFLAADIIDTAAMDFNDILHRSDETMDMVQFDDIRKLAKEAKGKLEWFSTHSSYMKDVDFGDKSDNMYGLLRNKARSILRKKKQK